MASKKNAWKIGLPLKHRVAMLRNMTTSLVKHERIETTLTKAKALRRVADRMVTYGKKGRKRDFIKCEGYLREPAMVHKVFLELADRYKDRPGGYTRVVRTRTRRGDGATMAYIEFVDREGEMREPRRVYEGMQEQQRKWGKQSKGVPTGFYSPIYQNGTAHLFAMPEQRPPVAESLNELVKGMDW